MGLRLPDHAKNLLYISLATGAHIVMGTGYYKQGWNGQLARISSRQLEETMQREIEVGVGPEKIRAGIIGEVGISGGGPDAHLSDPFERNVLLASARTARRTGVAISLHFDVAGWMSPVENWSLREEALNYIRSEGVSERRIVVGHCAPLPPRDPEGVADVAYMANYEGMLRALKRGVYLAFDGWGTFHKKDEFLAPVPKYTQYAGVVRDLIDQGFVDQILLSQDVCMQEQLSANKGCGYGHIVRDVVPYLRKAGIGEGDIAKITAANAQKLLTLV
jgi:phosphotriesterase-related protein